MSNLSPAAAVKAAGLRSLQQMSELCETPTRTLHDMYNRKPAQFQALLEGCKVLYARKTAPTLETIIDMVRTGGRPDYNDLRYAVAAFDVLIAGLHLEQDVSRAELWNIVSKQSPFETVKAHNDPDNPEHTAWYIAFNRIY